jgi:hypothetical protein
MSFGFILGLGGTAGREKAVTTSSMLAVDSFLNNSTENTQFARICKVRDDTYAILTNRGSRSSITVVEFDDDGLVADITQGQEVTGTAIYTESTHGILYLEDDKLLLTYIQASVEQIVVISVSGTTITTNTPLALTTGGSPVAALSSTKALVTLTNGKHAIATISGTTVTISSDITVGGGYTTGASGAQTGGFQAHAYDSSSVVLLRASDGAGSGNGLCSHLTVDTGAVTVTEDSVVTNFHASPITSKPMTLIVLSSTRFVSFCDEGARVIDRSSVVLSTPSTELTITSSGDTGACARGTSELLYLPATATTDAPQALKSIDVATSGALSDGGDKMQISLDVDNWTLMATMNNGYFLLAHSQGVSSYYLNPIYSINVE